MAGRRDASPCLGGGRYTGRLTAGGEGALLAGAVSRGIVNFFGFVVDGCVCRARLSGLTESVSQASSGELGKAA